MGWLGRSNPLGKDATSILKADFKSDNADRRDEDMTKQQADSEIAKAQIASRADPENEEKLLTLAEAYEVLNPEDPRVFNTADKLVRHVGVESLYPQRRADAFLLYGRQLFCKDRFEESVDFLEKARALYQADGTKRKRRDVNIGLLRAYSVLGKSKEAAQRLEVGLTLCDAQDDAILLYMHAKNALEKNGVERDTEVLDDIWYVYLDTHPTDKARWESFPKGDDVAKMLQDDKEFDWREEIQEAFRKLDPNLKQVMKHLMIIALGCLIMLIIIQIRLKGVKAEDSGK